jgi:hypothetical protein
VIETSAMVRLAALAVLCAVSALGQVATSTLFGSVTDSSGAAVPNVRVTATNAGTRAAETATTNADGNFVFPNLRPGTYTLAAEAGGFKRFQQSNILLEVNQRARVDIALAVGEVREIVEVSGNVTTVDTFSSTVKEVVDANRMVDLPLNGRNALQLQALLPGSIQMGANSAASLIALNTNIVFAVNGARPNQSAYTLDGGLNMDAYNNLPAAFPNPDALQEFSILQNSYSAVNGRNAGAVINMVTKSGTNQVRGTLYNFLRNDKLNTRNFFAAWPDPLKRNQFGGTFGGPVVLPKIYNGRDRTFVFFATEFTRQRFGQTNSSTRVPSELERRGDFSQTALPAGRFVADPSTVTATNPGVPFPNNVIPTSRLDPVAQAFTRAFFPLPNQPGQFYSYNLSLPTEEDQYTLKLDHAFGDRNRASLRYFYSDYRINFNHSLPAFNSNNNWSTHNITFTDSHIFSPNIVNNLTYTVARNTFIRSPLPTEGATDWAALGCVSCVPLAVNPTDWAININNGLNLRVNTAFFSYMMNYQFVDTLTITKGNHVMSLGGEMSFLRRNGREFFQVNPQWSFDGQRSNAFYGYADFYLGAPRTVFQNSPLRAWQYKYTPFLYFNDDWRVTKRLTLNMGLRWEPYVTVKERNDELGAFRPGQQSRIWLRAPAGALFPGDEGVERGIVPNRWRNFSPRFGFAFDPFGKGRTSIRGGYGIFFDTLRLVAMNTNSINQPFSLGLTTFDPFSLTDPYQNAPGVLPRLIAYGAPNPADRPTREFVAPVRHNSIDPFFNTGYMQQWNINVQQELWRSFVLTAGYIGSKGTGLMVGQNINPAVFVPGQSTPGNVNARRIHPGFEQIQNTQSTANSTYHSFQVSVNRRFSSGVSVLASYVWAKSLDLASNDGNSGVGNQATNPFNQSADKGPSDFDVRHRVVSSVLYELPFFNKTPGWKKTLLGGWQINAILTLQSGQPFTVSAGADRSLAGIGRDRADVIRSVETYGGLARQDFIARYFDTGAFVLPELGTFGTVGRNTIYGPGLVNLDTAIFKQFRFAERREVELRWETFNMANRPNFLNPVSAFTNPAFGRITSARDPRIMQFGLKLYY